MSLKPLRWSGRQVNSRLPQLLLNSLVPVLQRILKHFEAIASGSLNETDKEAAREEIRILDQTV